MAITSHQRTEKIDSFRVVGTQVHTTNSNHLKWTHYLTLGR